MRIFLMIALFMVSNHSIRAQVEVQGVVLDRTTGKPLSFAPIYTGSDFYGVTDMNGEFTMHLKERKPSFTVSYPGYYPKEISMQESAFFYQISLTPDLEASNPSNSLRARELIKRTIANIPRNDPQQALDTYEYKSYSKLFIDKQPENLSLSTNPPSPLNPNQGRHFLAEKVSAHSFKSKRPRELVEGLSTAGFTRPAYEILSLNFQFYSLYEPSYSVYKTKYAGPLGKQPFKNYSYTILDTLTDQEHPAYVVYFKPRRPNVVSGMQGVLFLDTTSLAIQKATSQLYGTTDVAVHHFYEYQENERIWFPVRQQIILKPGLGGEDIAIFGGNIALATIQRVPSILDILLPPGEIEDSLQLIATTTNYRIELNEPLLTSKYTARIQVSDSASERSTNFWARYRQEPLLPQDTLTGPRVNERMATENILRKVEVNTAISNGYYPVGIWDVELGKFISYNIYEGLRLGLGGKTNANFSEKFTLSSYLAYGFKDRSFKYQLGAGVLLLPRTGTRWNVQYEKDIREVGAFTYLRGIEEFNIIQPRRANINYHYAYKNIGTSIQHRISPGLDTEVGISRSDISQLRDYTYLHREKTFRSYIITEAKLGFLWRPFSEFLSTPDSHTIYRNGYPQFTGQLSRGISGLAGGAFDFTKIGLRVEHQIIRLDNAMTEFILEGNYGTGNLPLTHAFHANPNNPEKEAIISRFSLAGRISFETMYFNEFFSDRQAAFHIRHRLRPLRIAKYINPEVVILSRHVIGDFNNIQAHQNIQFETLEHLYSEAGVEINKILLGFGLSAAYRYGGYHLPTFKENFAFKFTFQLKI